MIHVLFDIDETLLSVKNNINAQTSAIMFKKVFGVNTDEETINNVGKTELRIIKEVLQKVKINLKEVPEIAYKTWGEAAAQELEKYPPHVLPGIKELLSNLIRNRNVKLALLTGNSPWRAEAKLKTTHLDHFFRNLTSKNLSGVFGNMSDKRSELFSIYKKHAGLSNRFIIIDDSLIGAKLAKSHKVPMIMVATGKATERQLKEFTPYTFPDFGESRWKSVISLIKTIS